MVKNYSTADTMMRDASPYTPSIWRSAVAGSSELMVPAIHLYTREYTGDGHVIKVETSDTWAGTDTTRVIESIQFDGGYFDNGGGANYYVKDYLGNIIAVVDQAGHLVQATDYYPYGLPFRMLEASDTNAATSGSTDKTVNRYLFGGKEFLTEDGLN